VNTTYYQILTSPIGASIPNYRGVYRVGPSYREDLPDESGRNQAWQELMQYDERLADLEVARRLAAQLADSGEPYDLVRVDVLTDAPADDVPGELGFDIAQFGSYSLLSWGLHWNGVANAGPPPMGPLLRLIEAYFRPQLNEHGLFSTWKAARFALDVIESIATLRPGTWESPGFERFDILRIAAIPIPPTVADRSHASPT
jgi:hypothetical protein